MNPMTGNTLEQRARELLAAECRKEGLNLTADDIMSGSNSASMSLRAIEAALRLSAGADWVLVPRDPTLAMTGAGQLFGLGPNMACTVYQSMIAAAPRHETGEG